MMDNGGADVVFYPRPRGQSGWRRFVAGWVAVTLLTWAAFYAAAWRRVEMTENRGALLTVGTVYLMLGGAWLASVVVMAIWGARYLKRLSQMGVQVSARSITWPIPSGEVVCLDWREIEEMSLIHCARLVSPPITRLRALHRTHQLPNGLERHEELVRLIATRAELEPTRTSWFATRYRKPTGPSLRRS